MSSKDNAAQIRLDERQHVEKPLLDQLAGLGWEIIDLDAKQHPGDSHRANFTEVVMLSVLREQLMVIRHVVDSKRQWLFEKVNHSPD